MYRRAQMPRYSEQQYKRAISKLNLVSKNDYSDKEQEMFHCCFHSGDDTPSLSINFKKGLYNCFACHVSGSIQSMIWDKLHMSMDRFLGLEDKGDMDSLHKPKIEEIPVRRKAPKDKELDIRGIVIPFNMSEGALKYLHARYIDLMTATRMNMKYTEEAYINGTFFKKRLLIPIYNEEQQLINMEGRDVTFKQEKKCLYPAGAIKPIYEWYKLDKEKPLYLFEGLIKMAVARSDSFFKNSTTIFGNKPTPRQIRILNEFQKVIIVPDNDKGGRVLIDFLKTALTTKWEVLKIVNQDIKDADEIPVKTGKTIEQYRLDGGFNLHIGLC
jgi:DNA primase